MLRERIFLDRNMVSSKLSIYKINGVVQNWFTPLYYKADQMVSGMVDVNEPGFKRRSLAGELVNNPMWKFAYSLKEMPVCVHMGGQCQYYDDYEAWEKFPIAHTLTAPYSTFVDSLLSPFNSESVVAQTKAWAEIDVSEIQGLASLGELPETVKMLIDLLKKALKLTLAAKRGDTKTIAKELEDLVSLDGVSNAWLMYRYGIRPLMSDIKNLLSAVQKDLEKSFRFTSRGKFDTGLLVSERVYDTNASTVYRWPVWKVKTGTRRIFRAGVLVEIDRSIDAMSAIWGLDSPIEAAWELVPFSFILDWFVNVGDCLGAAILNPSLNPKISWVTESLEFSELAVSNSLNNKVITNCMQKNPEPHIHQEGSSNLNLVVKRRCAVAAQYSLPRLNLKLDFAKLTDLLLIARKIF